MRYDSCKVSRRYSQTTLIGGSQMFGGNSYSYSHSTNRWNHGQGNRFESGVNATSGASRNFWVYTPTCDILGAH